jgi:DNA-directed RNA polymerase specialized sigma24 family protein
MDNPIEKKPRLTADQVKEVLANLSPVESARLRLLAQMRERFTHIPADDLIQTAFERLLSGVRRFPADTPAVRVIDRAMQSIGNSNVYEHDPLVDAEPFDADVVDGEPVMVNVPERNLEAQQELDALYCEDPVAAEVLSARVLGMSPAETQSELKIDATTYATTLRRFARRAAARK